MKNLINLGSVKLIKLFTFKPLNLISNEIRIFKKKISLKIMIIIFDQKIALDLEKRIKNLKLTDQAIWGKMNVSEILQH